MKNSESSNKHELVAYCGLYCGDCGGYSEDIAHAAKKLKEQLEKYKYELTVKAMFADHFKDYREFQKNLEFLTQMKCPIVCTQRNNPECAVWHCCREKGLQGCYECSSFEQCDILRNKLGPIFYDACMANLRNIQKLGIDVWIEKGKRYWFSCDVE